MTQPNNRRKRIPRSLAHARLGAELQRLRDNAGVSTRGIPGYSSGHLSSVESGCSTPSVNLIETYVSMFGNGPVVRALFQQVQHLAAEQRRKQFTKGDGDGDQPPAPQDMADVSTPNDVLRHYAVEMHNAHYVLGPTGAIESLEVNALLRAVSPHVRLYYAGYFYDADQRPGVLRTTAGRGLSPLTQFESENGALKSYFVLDRTLEPDDAAPFPVSYSLEVSSRERALPMLAYYSRPGTLRLSLSTRFTPPAVPRRLHWFEAPNVVNADQIPERELRPAGDGVYRREFDRLVPGWCYGFTWLW